MKSGSRKLLSGAAAAALLSGAAFADENGKTPTPYPCAENAATSIVAVCEAVKSVLPGVVCPNTTSTCQKIHPEIFTGLTGEVATPANIKSWNGQGVSGEVFQSVGLCLLRDLSAAPMKSHASASLPIGDISVNSVVDFMSFDPKAKTFKGSHRVTATAPVIGEIDLMTQIFDVKAVNGAGGGAVGQYAVTGSHALGFDADGGEEGFSFELDAITITTPYGTVTPKPFLALKRGSYVSLSPFGGASGLTMNPGGYQTSDVYGRAGGRATATGLVPMKLVPEPQDVSALSRFCGISIKDEKQCIAPSPVAWNSQLMLGTRNVDLKASAWKAPAGQAFPLRPDALIDQARGDDEKRHSGYASAGVRVEYSPIGLIPQAILDSGFITPTILVFATPNIAAAYGGQFNFWNAQASVWNPALTPPAPANPGTPIDVDSQHAMTLFGGASVGGRFAIDAGVDLVLKVHIPLPWPLEDIKFNILDVHPRTAFLETHDAETKAADRTAFVMTNAHQALKTGKPFQSYTPLTGKPADGFKHLQQCFADPPPPEKAPAKPEYEKGDPKAFEEFTDMPCNMCVGYSDFTYLDVKTQVPLTFEAKTKKGHAEKVPYVDDSAFAPADKWTCGGKLPSLPTLGGATLPPISSVKTPEQAKAWNKAAAAKAKNNMINAGCADQCTVDKATGKFKVVKTAKQLFAAGAMKDAPNGCY